MHNLLDHGHTPPRSIPFQLSFRRFFEFNNSSFPPIRHLRHLVLMCYASIWIYSPSMLFVLSLDFRLLSLSRIAYLVPPLRFPFPLGYHWVHASVRISAIASWIPRAHNHQRNRITDLEEFVSAAYLRLIRDLELAGALFAALFSRTLWT